MQWKGPFEVSSVVGLNDYRVKVKEKEKVYHANLLKKYFERDEATTEGTVAVAKVDDHFEEHMHCEVEECEVKDAEDDDNVDFLEMMLRNLLQMLPPGQILLTNSVLSLWA